MSPDEEEYVQRVLDETVEVELRRDETSSHDLRTADRAPEDERARSVSTGTNRVWSLLLEVKRTILGPSPAKMPIGPACLARTTSFFAAEPSPP